MSILSRSERPLLGAWSALGLMAASGVAFAALFPMSRERESRAFSSAPDMLALSYLDLALGRAPADSALRLRVTERTLAAGQFERARQTLAPLLGDAAAPEASALAVEIDYRAWAAVDAGAAGAKREALSRLVDDIEHARSERWPLASAEHLAWVCAQVDLRATRASILDRVARADLQNDERLRAADAAWLELEAPLRAARLRADRALGYPEHHGLVHAALALRRALASGQPGAALVLFRELRPLYGRNPRVLELGLSTLAGVDDVQALDVARELLALRPDDAALRERIARLDAWTRPPPPAAVAPRAPAPPALRWGGAAPEPSDALVAAGARASAGEASGAREVELAALLDSLGEPERALAQLDVALATGQVDERAAWDLRVGVQLRLGRKREALQTLEQMDARFGPTRASVERRAELSLALGDLTGALDLLASAPGPRDVADERRITAIGWELGDMPRVRSAYRVIARSSLATPDDVRRLWLLERDAGDLAASARVALSGFDRFGERDLLALALEAAVESNDDALLTSVLDTAERHAVELSTDPNSVRLQVSARQRRAQRALASAQLDHARSELAHSAHLLDTARADAPDLKDAFGKLWQTQSRQNMDLALSTNDRQLLARVYPEQAEKLGPRERVFVLHQLGRDEDAVSEAVTHLEARDLPARDRGPLQADADALGADMPRQVSVLGDVLTMQGLTAARAGARAQLGWSGGRQLGAQLELSRLGTGPASEVLRSGHDELAAEVSGGIGHSRLSLGVALLDGQDPRPSLRFEQGLLQGDSLDVELSARVNERSHDTAELRLLGVEDELAARASLAFEDSYSASLGASGKLYSDRDRNYLGGGATFDASLGRHWALPGELSSNVRVAGYVAPRFEADPTGPVPDGASWVGLGASLMRGQMSVAPVAGRRLCVLVDATAGWLLPLDELGWSGKLGLGISVLGADQLSIMASASNVVSTLPGFAVYTLGADYAVSRW